MECEFLLKNLEHVNSIEKQAQEKVGNSYEKNKNNLHAGSRH